MKQKDGYIRMVIDPQAPGGWRTPHWYELVWEWLTFFLPLYPRYIARRLLWRWRYDLPRRFHRALQMPDRPRE